MVKPNATGLKKITPNGTLLYSHISFLLSHQERRFLLQQMGIQRPTSCAETELGTHSSKGDVSIKSSPSELRGPYRKGRSGGDRGHQENKALENTRAKLTGTQAEAGGTRGLFMLQLSVWELHRAPECENN